MKETNKSLSYCVQDNNWFDYYEKENALCGKTFPNEFTPKRIVVVQMN